MDGFPKLARALALALILATAASLAFASTAKPAKPATSSTAAAPAKPASSTAQATPASTAPAKPASSDAHATPASTAPAKPAVSTAHAVPKSSAKPATKPAAKPAAPAKSASHAPAAPDSAITGALNGLSVTSLASLIRGNLRFVGGQPTHPHEEVERRQALASGQKPHAIVLSCSDSRVPPEVVFDQGLGDLFVVRTAGEVLDRAATASIEYAVKELAVPVIVVMGHESCDAVHAALTTAPEAAPSEDLRYLIGALRPVVLPYAAASKGDSLFDRPVRAQVDATVAALLRRSAIVREAVVHGHLTVVPAIEHLASGEVEMWDAQMPVATGD